MKTILKVSIAIVLIGMIVFVVSILFEPKYESIPVGPDALSSNDIEVLKKFGFISDSEKVVLFYSTKRIDKSGCLITNKRVTSYDPGQRFENAESVRLDSILDVKLLPSLSIAKYSRINVTRKDSTTFTIVVGAASYSDQKFFNMLNKEWKQSAK